MAVGARYANTDERLARRMRVGACAPEIFGSPTRTRVFVFHDYFRRLAYEAFCKGSALPVGYQGEFLGSGLTDFWRDCAMHRRSDSSGPLGERKYVDARERVALEHAEGRHEVEIAFAGESGH